MSDIERAKFLIRLDESDKVEVSGFEASFIDNNLRRCKLMVEDVVTASQFSHKQREVIDQMFDRYAGQL